jgi:hypothetical protein
MVRFSSSTDGGFVALKSVLNNWLDELRTRQSSVCASADNYFQCGNEELVKFRKTKTGSSQLQDAIRRFGEAIRLAGAAQPQDGLTYIRAHIATAECYRELSHRNKFGHSQKTQYLADAMMHLNKAYEKAEWMESDALMLRVKLERAVIRARGVMLEEAALGGELGAVLQARHRATEELKLVIEESREMGMVDFCRWGTKWLGLLEGHKNP